MRNEFGDLDVDDGRTVLKWAVGLSKFFDHYRGIKDFVLDKETGDGRISRSLAPNPEIYAGNLCDDLALILQEQKMPKGKIATKQTELELSEIWDYLCKYQFLNLEEIMEEILVDLVKTIFKSESVGAFTHEMQSFETKLDNPVHNFINKLGGLL